MSGYRGVRAIVRSLSSTRSATSIGVARVPYLLSLRIHKASAALISQCPHRHFATPPPQVKLSDLPIEQYHQYSDATMDKLLGSLEDLLDEVADPAYEVEYGSGVLTLRLGDSGTYVINKQPPNKQIWLSSPFSGPKRYDYKPEEDGWVYSRDGQSLNDLLNKELSEILGRTVDLGLDAVSKVV